jgi:hydroxymethylglutaryl-CoA lyase
VSPRVSDVRVKDIAPRLAFQAHAAPTEVKVELVDRLTAAGVPAVEVSSFVRPDLVPGLADAREVFARVDRSTGATFHCCIGNERGLRDAIDAGVDTAWFLLSADPGFARNNIGRSTDESLALLEHLTTLSAGTGTSVGTYVIFAWGGPAGLPRGPESLDPIGRRLVDIGVRQWILADSAGYAAPPQVRELVEHAAGLTGLDNLTVQVHDARGMGVANVAELVDVGLRNIDTSVGGAGGHPAMPGVPGGGVCTEDVVQLLDRMGVRTGIDLGQVIDAATWLADVVGAPTQGFVRRVGAVPTHGVTHDEAAAFAWAPR